MNANKPIYVTQPSLPPLEEFIPYLEKIWHNKILTNRGPFHQQLEMALCEYLGVQSVHRDNLPVATAAAQKVMCLPIYPALSTLDVESIARVIGSQPS